METGRSDTDHDLKVGCGFTFGNCNTYLEVDFKCRFELNVTVPFRNSSMEIQGGSSVPSSRLISSGQSCEIRKQAGIS